MLSKIPQKVWDKMCEINKAGKNDGKPRTYQAKQNIASHR